jgi:hypothetical protein
MHTSVCNSFFNVATCDTAADLCCDNCLLRQSSAQQPSSTAPSTILRLTYSVSATALVVHAPQLQASIAALSQQQQHLGIDDGGSSIDSDSSMTVFEDSGLGLSVLIKRTRKLQGVTPAAAHAAIAALVGGEWAASRNAKIRNASSSNGLASDRKSSVYDGSSSSSSRTAGAQLLW